MGLIGIVLVFRGVPKLLEVTMLDAKKLLEYTQLYNPKLFANAKTVRVTRMRAVNALDEDGDPCRIITATCQGNTMPRTVTIRAYGPRLVTAKLWVSCDCPFFLYHAEVANTRKGSSDIIYSNGASPKITNPGGIPHLCKHAISAIRAGALTLQPTNEIPAKSLDKSKTKGDEGKKPRINPFLPRRK